MMRAHWRRSAGKLGNRNDRFASGGDDSWIGEQAVERFDLMSGEETRGTDDDRCRNLSLIALDPVAALESTRPRTESDAFVELPLSDEKCMGVDNDARTRGAVITFHIPASLTPPHDLRHHLTTSSKDSKTAHTRMGSHLNSLIDSTSPPRKMTTRCLPRAG
jgi:hypothetical protein